ncbi:MAG: PVC-type heme-binding CxxCH protein, partial [Planctomycetota bacterium]
MRFPSVLCLVFVSSLASLSLAAPGRNEFHFPPHRIRVPEGFVVEQAAKPPLVDRPINMCFDESGALFVTDSSGNSEKAPKQLENPTHRLLRLVDQDGDGNFDRSSVFAEKLPFPEGVLCHQGSVYVTAPPHIWKFRDTDGDHVADERTVWFDGGTIEPCGNDLHGPYLGPDGFFYWCKGAFQKQTHRLGDGRLFESSAAHIYRAKPDGSQLEVVITGGMNNPVGIAFHENGERFLSGTFFDLSKPGRRDGILHAVYGGIYGRENDRVLKPHPQTVGLLPVLQQLGPSASSGLLMPRHTALGLRGDLVGAEFNLKRVSRYRMKRVGSTYVATPVGLLWSNRSDFHPTDVIEDADGSLLIADTGSWYQICCPTSKISKPHILGAIYRLKKADQPKARDPRGLLLDWSRPSVAWLSDERPTVVRRAIDSLAHEDHISDLRKSPARVSAVWTLHRIDDQKARVAVRGFLDDENVDARVAAIHSVALWRDGGAGESLIHMLRAGAPQLRRLSAMALGRIGDRRAVKSLLASPGSDRDPFLTHAIIYALYEIADGEDLAGSHPYVEQVRRMQYLDKSRLPTHALPEFELADDIELDAEETARRSTRLAELMRYFPKGDARRGAKLFHNEAKTRCLTCHTLGNAGTGYGPDLSSIGAIRSERDLLEAIVYPSSSIARYYELIQVHKKRGFAAGVLKRDTVHHIVLASAPGVEQKIPIRNIRKAKYSSVSPMPDGFDGILQPNEIADLVAFLKEAKGVTEPPDKDAIPPHVAVDLPGLHAYAQKSLDAGEE